jgi:hypothetical protein
LPFVARLLWADVRDAGEGSSVPSFPQRIPDAATKHRGGRIWSVRVVVDRDGREPLYRSLRTRTAPSAAAASLSLSLSPAPFRAPGIRSPALDKGLGVSLTPAGSTDSAADERIFEKKQGTR